MLFEYSAIDTNGKRQNGSIEADSEHNALIQLQKRELKPLDVCQASQRVLAKQTIKLNIRQWAEFFLSLSVLCGSSINLENALLSLKNDPENKKLTKVSGVLYDHLTSGGETSSWFMNESNLPPAFCAIIASGEQSRTLDRSFHAIAKHFQIHIKRRQVLSNAIAYPAFLLFASVLVLLFLANVLIPSLTPIFSDFDKPLPSVLSALAVLQFQNETLPMYVAATLVFILTAFLFRTALKDICINALLMLPLTRRLIRAMILGPYFSSLAVLATNKVSIERSLKLLNDNQAAGPLHAKLSQATENIINGQKVADAFGESSLLPHRYQSLLIAGEKASNLPFMFEKIGDALQEDANLRLQQASVMLGPIVTLIIGGIIGLIVVSVLGALMDINSFATQ